MTSTKASGVGHQPSAFLDRTVWESLYLLWDACQHANLQLHEGSSWEDLSGALESAGVATDALKAADAESVLRGMRAFKCLRDAVSRYRFFSSNVCRAEARHALLEAQGLEWLVRRGVPHSLRTRRPQPLYRIFLRKPDYLQLADQVEALRSTMIEEYGILISDVEDPAVGSRVTSDDIWASAEAIGSHVLMGVLDAYACAAAMRVGADVFLSADPDLRHALDQLREPDSDWATTVDSLKEALGVATNTDFPVFRNAAGVLA